MENKAFKIAYIMEAPFVENDLKLFEHLAKKGCLVTLALFDAKLLSLIKKKICHHRIELELIPPPQTKISSLAPAIHSYALFEWLFARQGAFDIVELPLRKGVGYYPMLAQELAIAFEELSFCVRYSPCLIEEKIAHCQWISSLDEMAIHFMERESLRRSQGVMIESQETFSTPDPFEETLQKKPLILEKGSSAEEIELLYAALLSIQQKKIDTAKKQIGLVSICLTHFNRPDMLHQALASIRAQDYPEIEVILIDDASSTQDAIAYLKSLEEEFNAKGWTLIRNTYNRYPSYCRNLAAKKSSGKYLLFMDDDNIATPHEVSVFVQAAEKTGADILTCAMDVFSGSSIPFKPLYRFLPLGHCAEMGLHLNLFGDMNALIKKSVYEELGGLTEKKGIGGEDWQFFSQAVLKGYQLRAIPLALFWYRDTPQSITKMTSSYANHLRAMEPYLESIPLALRPLLMLNRGQQEELHALRIFMQSPRALLNHACSLVFSKAKKAIKNPKKIVASFRAMFQAKGE